LAGGDLKRLGWVRLNKAWRRKEMPRFLTPRATFALLLLPAVAWLGLSAPAFSAPKKGDYEANGWLIWDELVDPGWNPEDIFKDLKINEMADNDQRYEEVVEEFVRRWNNAPVNPNMDGKKIKIPGFVVPLDFEETQISEFFLVPYFGACIHVPPPPPNQIIYVKSQKGIKNVEVMDIVWVYGILRTDRFEVEDLGLAGYTLPADIVEPYREDG
jgi:hypothetical protein